jgi:predicted nucleic acid-binding protein
MSRTNLFQIALKLFLMIRNAIFYLWRPNLGDEGDDFLVELAVASNSKTIITDNKKDLESGELHFDFEVLTPQEFLKRNKQ